MIGDLLHNGADECLVFGLEDMGRGFARPPKELAGDIAVYHPNGQLVATREFVVEGYGLGRCHVFQ